MRPLGLLLCPLVSLLQKQECVLQAKQVFSTHLIALKMVFGTNNTLQDEGITMKVIFKGITRAINPKYHSKHLYKHLNSTVIFKYHHSASYTGNITSCCHLCCYKCAARVTIQMATNE